MSRMAIVGLMNARSVSLKSLPYATRRPQLATPSLVTERRGGAAGVGGH